MFNLTDHPVLNMNCNKIFSFQLTLMARKSSLPYSRVFTMTAVGDDDNEDDDDEVSTVTVSDPDSLLGDMTVLVPPLISD